MAISDANFDAEGELQDWVFANIGTFFGDCILLPGFRVATASGKTGVPDGFAFSFGRRAWWVIECELLKHGVWPHIAEQITRFVVALRNPATFRQIRDKLFERVVADQLVESLANSLNTESARVLQQIELFVESIDPAVAIFIDETDQDLTDFCNALDIVTETYRVKKFIVDGRPEYYSPDKNTPAIVTLPQETGNEGAASVDVITQLGGGEVLNGKLRCFKLNDGRIVRVQYSKFHERHQYYWYGINPSPFEQALEMHCTHYVFIMGGDGFVTLPIGVVEQYLTSAYASQNADGSIRHYHLCISPPPDVQLKGFGNTDNVDASDAFQSFN